MCSYPTPELNLETTTCEPCPDSEPLYESRDIIQWMQENLIEKNGVAVAPMR